MSKKNKSQRAAKADTSSKEEDTPKQDAQQNTAEVKAPPHSVVPIVGIGASAGGLSMFKEFFAYMPPNSGLAFVLVQHLDPKHKSMLVEILTNYTSMPVHQIKDGMPVEPNHVYIIPPNRDIALSKGILFLLEPTIAARGIHLPIDYFFRSLASDLAEHSIVVILTGNGTDGTLGLKAVKEAAGMVMVQDPKTAEYSAMPSSAMATGLVDYTLAVGAMPKQIIDYVTHATQIEVSKIDQPPLEGSDELEKIFILLRQQTGHDFSRYKRPTIHRRIERRMSVNLINNLTGYVRYLQHTPMEIEALFRDILIGVTSFLRDPEAFESLVEHALISLVMSKPGGAVIRVWIPGCATGEEAYTVAMLLHEQIERMAKQFRVQIFATDLDPMAIAEARKGRYPDSIAAQISSERLNNYFAKEENFFRVNSILRDIVIFAQQNLIHDPPFSNLDLICCRNLLIYMEAELQRQVLNTFHYALNPSGFLFLGSSESLGESENNFTAIDKKWKIFQTRGSKHATLPNIDLPPARLQTARGRARTYQFPAVPAPDIRQLTEQALLSEHVPASVTINEMGDVLYVQGDVDRYLQTARGESSLNILRMARESLRMALTTSLRVAVTQGQTVQQSAIRISHAEQQYAVNMTVKPLSSKQALPQNLYLVLFESKLIDPNGPDKAEQATPDEAREQRVVELEQEINTTREHLQTVIEELEASNEELTSINEELQSANEEMQSTNEELETSKEEMQSINEELVTVNAELGQKIQLLTDLNNDMHNLLISLDAGIVFLNQHLRLKMFTPAARQIINLIQTDIGRPISDIVNSLIEVDLATDAQQVLDELTNIRREVQTRDKHWYLMRIMPYRTVDNIIAGVVLTFNDITQQKNSEAGLRYSEQRLALALEASGAGLYDHKVPLDESTYHSERWANILGYTRAELPVYQHFMQWLGEQVHPEDTARLDKAYKDFIEGRDPKYHAEIRLKHKTGKWVYVEEFSRAAAHSKTGKVTHVVGLMVDITARKQVEKELQGSRHLLEQRVAERTTALSAVNKQLRQEMEERELAQEALKASEALYVAILESAPEGVAVVDSQGQIILINNKTEEMFGYSRHELLRQPIEVLLPERLRKVHAQHRNAYLEAHPTQPMKLGLDLVGQRKDGSEFPIEIGLSATESKGEMLLTSIITNIAVRIHSEQALLQSEEQYRTLAEHSRDYIARFDRNHRHLYLNQAAASLAGKQPEDFIGKTLYEVGLPQELCDFGTEHMKKAFETGQITSRQFVFESVEGPLVLDWALVPEFDAKGEIQSLLSSTRNITAQRQNEENLKASQMRYQRILETADEGVWMVDQDYVTTFVNDKMAAMLGYTVDEMHGKSAAEYNEGRNENELARLRERRAAGENDTFEQRFRRKDGSFMWSKVSASPILNDAGEFTGAFAMISDISSFKHMEVELKAYMQLLETAAENADGKLWRKRFAPNVEASVPDGKSASSRRRRSNDYDHETFLDSFETWLQRIHADDQESVKQTIQAHLAGFTELYEIRYRVPHKDGTTHEIYSLGRIQRDEQDHPIKWTGIDWNVTERMEVNGDIGNR